MLCESDVCFIVYLIRYTCTRLGHEHGMHLQKLVSVVIHEPVILATTAKGVYTLGGGKQSDSLI